MIYHQINVLAVKFGCYFVGTALLLGTRALIHAGVPLEIINHEYLLTPPTILKGSYEENQEYRILVTNYPLAITATSYSLLWPYQLFQGGLKRCRKESWSTQPVE